MSREQRIPRAGPDAGSNGEHGHSTKGHLSTGDCVDQTRVFAARRAMRGRDFGVRLPLDWASVPGNVSEVCSPIRVASMVPSL
jgi:hypothetical protein